MPSNKKQIPSSSSSLPSPKRHKAAKPVKTTSRVHWDKDLTWDLVRGITDNIDICVGLFLGPQSHPLYPNDPRGTRTDWFLELADIIFSDHPKYGPAYLAESDSEKWAMKVQKRCDTLISEVRKHIREMDRAGPDIMSKDEIDFSRDTPFTTLARKVLAECPWYFEVKAILDEARLGPPGGFPVGNSRTPINQNAFLQLNRGVKRRRHEDSVEEEEEGNDESDEGGPPRELRRRYEAAMKQQGTLDKKLRRLAVERARIKAKAELKLQRLRVKYMVREAKMKHDVEAQLRKERKAALGALYRAHPYQPPPEVEYLVPVPFVPPPLDV